MTTTAQQDDPRRFEGTSLEEVLADVRRTLGADAEVVEANKVRSGGLGGFFAKETFEVLARPRLAGRRGPTGAVDDVGLPPGIDQAAFDRAAAHVAQARGQSSSDLLGLADQVNQAERASDPRPAPGAAPSGGVSPQQHPLGPTGHTTPAPSGGVSPQQHPLGPTGHTTPAPNGGVSPQQHPLRPTGHTRPSDPFEPMSIDAMPRLSTEGGAFNDVLHRIATDAGPEIAEAIDRRLGAVRQEQRQEQRPLQPVGPQARTLASRPDGHQHGRLHQATMPAQVVAPAPAQVVAPAPMPPPAPTPPPAPPAGVQALPPPPQPSSNLPTPAVGEVPAPAAEAGVPESRTQRLLSWLERDNLPRTTLMTALRALPAVPALPDTPGVVVAVIGRRQEALRLCRQLAKAHDADPDDVVLASSDYKGSSIPAERRIASVTDATRDRAAWRRREQPTFVAVDAPGGVSAKQLTWTREIVDQLEAHQVIGVVSATRKIEDIATWAQHLGGFDAIALRDIEQTTTPHAVLALEIPIAFLDDDRATPGSWAHLLLEGSTA